MAGAMRRWTLAMSLGAVAGFLTPGMALAQGSVAAQEVTIPGGALVLVAYMTLWVLFGGYLSLILRKQKQVQRDIEALERRIDEVFSSPEG